MKRLIAVAALGLAVTGCSSSGLPNPPSAASTTPAAASSVVAASAAGCTRSLLPHGYVTDPRHTGKLSAHNYSQSADVQAALEFDQLGSGARRVFIHRNSRTVDGVVSCIAMRFATPHLANRFFLSYRALRRDAGSLVTTVSLGTPIRGLSGVTGYHERQQSFRGYRISSTTVIEAAGQAGDSLYIASVAGSHPSVALAHRLLRSLADER